MTADPEPTSSHDDDIAADRPLPTYYRVTKTGGAATVLGAAMIAVGDILEPDRATVEVVRVDDDSLDETDFDLRFGDLPDLES